jgi:hypothetical protein
VQHVSAVLLFKLSRPALHHHHITHQRHRPRPALSCWQVLGADVGRAQLHWMHKRLLGPHAAAALAEAAGQVAREQLAAYGLVAKVERGVVSCGGNGIDCMQQQQQQHRLGLLARSLGC